MAAAAAVAQFKAAHHHASEHGTQVFTRYGKQFPLRLKNGFSSRRCGKVGRPPAAYRQQKRRHGCCGDATGHARTAVVAGSPGKSVGPAAKNTASALFQCCGALVARSRTSSSRNGSRRQFYGRSWLA